MQSRNNKREFEQAYIFLKNSWKNMIIMGILGALVFAVYHAVAPKRYEATARIVMAQTISPGAPLNRLNISMVNLEEPSLVVTRITFNPIFKSLVQDGCSSSDEIRLTPMKSSNNILEIKILGQSMQAAKACADAVFRYIKATQEQMNEPYIEDINALMKEDELRLITLRAEIKRTSDAGYLTGASYFMIRDQSEFLMAEIRTIRNILTNINSKGARLIAPIAASDIPIGRSRTMSLLIGFLAGALLGGLLSIVYQHKMQSTRD